MKKEKAFYYKNNQFVIENYDEQRPFASFLPGVAGLNGIPIWAYYTNRGQGIAGFGIENKDGAILDFVPANQAYRRTEISGFRTFIKKEGQVHEIFSSSTTDEVNRKMVIEANAVGFIEENKTLSLKIHVKYFTVTNEKYPGLVRKLLIEDLSKSGGRIQVADGLMTLWPYGNNNGAIKDMSNLSVAWFEVYNTENDIPFFRNRSTSSDSAEVGTIEAGHFFAPVSENDLRNPVIYDPEILFGQNTSLSIPREFEKYDLDELITMQQQSANKIPCAFSLYDGEIDGSLGMASIIGKMNSVGILNETTSGFNMKYIEELEKRAVELGESLTLPVEGKTAYPEFDAYVKQSFLDNLLRGGFPLVFEGKDGPIVYHVYSRIHGDMEREYNYFVVEPAYFSQGIGAFRDVNQNRRNDVYFVKEAGLFNVKLFMELIQLDGQNPLSINGSKFRVSDQDAVLLSEYVEKDSEHILSLLKTDFTPGQLMKNIDDYNLKLRIRTDDFLKVVLSKSKQIVRSAYGHGYWVDHWTYNMDLVDNYLNVYPEKFEELLFNISLRYFISPATVLPRKDKYVLNNQGKARQYDAIIEDKERLKKLGIDYRETNWHITKSGKPLVTSLFVKLISLVLNKMTNLDQSGIGIMMNTDKPGWNDAMNGLPGLFGSGTSETIELRRVVELLLKASATDIKVEMPTELYEFYLRYKGVLNKNLKGELDQFGFFEAAQNMKEIFNEVIFLEVSGEFKLIPASSFRGFLENTLDKINRAIDKAIQLGKGIMPSYLVHDAAEFEIVDEKKHPVNGLQNIKVTKWNLRALPLYLEAPARYLKQVHDKKAAGELFSLIKKSGMYDKKLKMYITSESLEKESLEIGRARAFSAGWLERESVFMHMEYKYLLGLLKSGLYKEFFEAVKTALPPFMDPSIYGRSTLENSSFIASSRNPDTSNHGRGFVSRLTGTTSEMISIWLYMMIGAKLFSIDNGQLTFELNPVLPAEYFDEKNEVSFRIFGSINIKYINEERRNTFGENKAVIKQYTLHYPDGNNKTLSVIKGKDAADIRNGRIEKIEAILV